MTFLNSKATAFGAAAVFYCFLTLSALISLEFFSTKVLQQVSIQVPTGVVLMFAA